MIGFTESLNGITKHGDPVKKFRMYVPYFVLNRLSEEGDQGELRELVPRLAKCDDINSRYVMQSWRILLNKIIPLLDSLVATKSVYIDKEKYLEWRKNLVTYRNEKVPPQKRIALSPRL